MLYRLARLLQTEGLSMPCTAVRQKWHWFHNPSIKEYFRPEQPCPMESHIWIKNKKKKNMNKQQLEKHTHEETELIAMNATLYWSVVRFSRVAWWVMNKFLLPTLCPHCFRWRFNFPRKKAWSFLQGYDLTCTLSHDHTVQHVVLAEPWRSDSQNC